MSLTVNLPTPPSILSLSSTFSLNLLGTGQVVVTVLDASPSLLSLGRLLQPCQDSVVKV